MVACKPFSGLTASHFLIGRQALRSYCAPESIRDGKQMGSRWEVFGKQVGSFTCPESIPDEAKRPTHPLIINKNTPKCTLAWSAGRETKKNCAG